MAYSRNIILILLFLIVVDSYENSKPVRNLRQRSNSIRRPSSLNLDSHSTSTRPTYSVESIEGGNQWKPLFIEPEPSAQKLRKYTRLPPNYNQNSIHVTELYPKRYHSHNQSVLINDYVNPKKLKGDKQSTKTPQYEVYEYIQDDTYDARKNHRFRYQETAIERNPGKNFRKSNLIPGKHVHHYYYHDDEEQPVRKNRQNSYRASFRSGRTPLTSKNFYY